VLIHLVVVTGIVAVGTFSAPSLQSATTEWGTVTNDTAEIRTSVTVENPNPIGIPGVVDVEYTVRLNDVVLATGAQRGVGFPAGTSNLTLSTAMDVGKIPEWWVAHVENGERSTLRVVATVSGPLGFERTTTVRNTSFETDLLAPLDTDSDERIEVAGRTALVVEKTRADWEAGEATPDRAPFTVRITATNERSVPVTVAAVRYTVDASEVRIGNGTAPESYRIPPGETRVVAFSLALDGEKMDEWWTAHVRNDERSRIRFDVEAAVETDGRTGTASIDSVEVERVVRTDALNRTGR
jgi:LEA14-like dessication related protein